MVTSENEQPVKLCTCSFCGEKQPCFQSSSQEKIATFQKATAMRLDYVFSGAETLINAALSSNESDEDNFMLFWSALLCEFGVTYLYLPCSKRKIPVPTQNTDSEVTASENYLKTIETSPEEFKEYFQREAARIQNYLDAVANFPLTPPKYDIVFISPSINEKSSAVQSFVKELVSGLISDGNRVFYDQNDLAEIPLDQRAPYYVNAYRSAILMILFGTEEDEFLADPLRPCYTTYLNLHDKLGVSGKLYVIRIGKPEITFSKPLAEFPIFQRQSPHKSELESLRKSINPYAKKEKKHWKPSKEYIFLIHAIYIIFYLLILLMMWLF